MKRRDIKQNQLTLSILLEDQLSLLVIVLVLSTSPVLSSLSLVLGHLDLLLSYAWIGEARKAMGQGKEEGARAIFRGRDSRKKKNSNGQSSSILTI